MGYDETCISREKSVKGDNMDKQKSFENAIENAKSLGFRGAMQKMKAVDFAAEFEKRGVNVNSGFEKE